MDSMDKKADMVSPGSGSASCLDNGTIEWHKEGKIHLVLAKLRLNYLYYMQVEMSKRVSRCCSIRMGICPAYESVLWGDFLKQVTRGTGGKPGWSVKSSSIEQLKND